MNTVGIGDVVRYRYEVGDISSGQLATIVDDYGLGSYLVEVASGRRYYATAHEFDLCSEHMATITERLAGVAPLPWTTQQHDCYVPDDENGEPLQIVAADGTTVADNVTYYATQVQPDVQRAIVTAMNAHDALVAALAEARYELKVGGCDPLHVCGMIDAALALARE